MKQHENAEHKSSYGDEEEVICTKCNKWFGKDALSKHQAWVHGIKQRQNTLDAIIHKTSVMDIDDRDDSETDSENELIVPNENENDNNYIAIPTYEHFNDKEQQELQSSRKLCKKLVENLPEIYNDSAFARKLNLDHSLFINWLYDTGKQPKLINDLRIPHIQIPQSVLIENEYLSIKNIRKALKDIMFELTVSSPSRDPETNKKVKDISSLLNKWKLNVYGHDNTVNRQRTARKSLFNRRL